MITGLLSTRASVLRKIELVEAQSRARHGDVEPGPVDRGLWSNGQDREGVGRYLPVDRAPATATAAGTQLTKALPHLSLDRARVGVRQPGPLGFQLLDSVEDGGLFARRL